jgi:hypothetical protein
MREDKQYRDLRKTFIALLRDFERAKGKFEAASRLASAIGGSLGKETSALKAKFERLSEAILKLEQETREI